MREYFTLEPVVRKLVWYILRPLPPRPIVEDTR